MIEFYFATSNSHKIIEAQDALSSYNISVKKLGAIEKVEIQHVNLEAITENALRLIVSQTDKPVFVEDSGLFIHSLNGFPGPYSSYVFETLGLDGILRLLSDAKSRKAEFRSSVSFGSKGRILATFSSVTEGTITTQTRGESGFGFDPIFVPLWTNKTFAQMELKEKSVYSHRAKALKKLALWYLNALKTGELKESEVQTESSAGDDIQRRRRGNPQNRNKSWR